MTVCIAGLVSWRYGENDLGRAIVTASDRMLTLGEFEYEPPQLKVGRLGRRILLLVAGNFTVHSEALGKTLKHLSGLQLEDVAEVAEVYASYVRKYRLREAAQTYLAPLGLDEASFSTAQQSMSPNVVADLVSQMQNHRIDAEAIVAGCDSSLANLFHVDGRGFVTCHNDPGFVSIGIGSGHANSHIMTSQYANWWAYGRAAILLYTAKKRAEVAPGVGAHTDMHIITRDGVSPVDSSIQEKIDAIYKAGVERDKQNADTDEEELLQFFNTMREPNDAAADQPASAAISSSDQT